MASKEEFCDDYLVLRPHEGGIFDLLKLLCSCNIDYKSKYIECPQGTELKDFRRRWLIVVSIILQKIFGVLEKPVLWMGMWFEMGMNLLSSKRSLAGLLLDLLQGKLVMPDKTSATFKSFLAYVDTRVELDKNIKYGDSKYYGALSIMASKLVYENEAFIKAIVTVHWKMDFLGFYNFWNDYQNRLSTQAFMLQDKSADPEFILVAFRGTEPFNTDAWQTDVDLSWYNLHNVGKVHSGFMKALGLKKTKGWPKEIVRQTDQDNDHPLAYYTIRENLKVLLQKNDRAKFIVTGHSLGGALAILFLLVLMVHEEEWLLKRLEGVYTYGQPRVGDKQVGEFIKKEMSLHEAKYIRYVYCNDMVPRLPYDDSTTMFKHFGTCLYYNSFYKGKIVEEEPNKNYFSVFKVVPKILNAAWELIRGFVMPYMEGPDYKESWLLRMVRMIGLMIPGLSAHAIQDYVNASRLGSILNPEEGDQIHQDPKLD